MQFSPEDKNALVHLYRGELSRMVAYRTRLDTTTNWAVVTSAALITFTLGNAAVPHYVLLLAVLLAAVFMAMEARRYRYFELARRRVRLLESGFYAEVLGGPAGDWEAPLRESLRQPRLPIGLLPAATVRLRNSYMGLFGVVYAAWFLKLYLSRAPLLEGARIGVVPGGVVLALAVLVLAALAVLAVTRAEPEED